MVFVFGRYFMQFFLEWIFDGGVVEWEFFFGDIFGIFWILFVVFLVVFVLLILMGQLGGIGF